MTHPLRRVRDQWDLGRDQPGAPVGYIIDRTDNRTGSHTYGDRTGCAEPVDPELWDTDGDLLARGYGEDDGVT